MRMGCCGAAAVAVNVGFAIVVSADRSLSSESSGAATRNASTSFSRRASSSSFCLKTSYTFFIFSTCGEQIREKRLIRTLCSYLGFVKKRNGLAGGNRERRTDFVTVQEASDVRCSDESSIRGWL